jgi:cell wall-associated NlpC family hydrolase
MTSRQPRLGALVGIALICCPWLSAPASAGPVEAKQQEAARIQAQLDAQGERISILDEQYNRARLQVDAADSTLARTDGERTAADTRFRDARGRLGRHAVDAYVHGGSSTLVEELAKSRGPDLPLRQHYLGITAASERRAIDELHVAREDLIKVRERNKSAQAAARAAVSTLKGRRADVERAVSIQRNTLARVNGEVGQLIAAEQARKAAEEARRAQAELAARQAAERAQLLTRRLPPRSTTTTAHQESNPKPTPPPTTTTPTPTPAPPTSAPPVGRGAAAAVAEARRQIGKPYVWAAAGPDTFDCSGLTQWAWRAGGVRLSHSTYAQWDETPHIPVSALQPGDLVFFGADLHHVAIYSGGGMMIEAPYTGATVRETALRTKDLAGATRPG